MNYSVTFQNTQTDANIRTQTNIAIGITVIGLLTALITLI